MLYFENIIISKCQTIINSVKHGWESENEIKISDKKKTFSSNTFLYYKLEFDEIQKCIYFFILLKIILENVGLNILFVLKF